MMVDPMLVFQFFSFFCISNPHIEREHSYGTCSDWLLIAIYIFYKIMCLLTQLSNFHTPRVFNRLFGHSQIGFPCFSRFPYIPQSSLDGVAPPIQDPVCASPCL